jgi:hypothetical protein
MNVAALGTAISFAKFIFLPHKADGEEAVKPGFWPAAICCSVVCLWQTLPITRLIPCEYRETTGNHRSWLVGVSFDF